MPSIEYRPSPARLRPRRPFLLSALITSPSFRFTTPLASTLSCSARANVGQTWRNGSQPLTGPQQTIPPTSPLRPGTAFQLRMPCSDLRFDGRDLLAAACDSCSLFLAFRRRELVEASPVAIEHR